MFTFDLCEFHLSILCTVQVSPTVEEGSISACLMCLCTVQYVSPIVEEERLSALMETFFSLTSHCSRYSFIFSAILSEMKKSKICYIKRQVLTYQLFNIYFVKSYLGLIVVKDSQTPPPPTLTPPKGRGGGGD